jgi:signal transduction histidine kinase/ligand-binding sensor domain-containing protein
MRGLLIFLTVLLSLELQAQQYRFEQYRVEDGLPSDVIKAVCEDSLGFLWIATDDGLVRYDGINFRTYENALRSQFVKGFLMTKDRRLLAFSDLDLVEVQNHIDTVSFRTILRGERFETDSTLAYPKSLYEDRNRTLWVGEPKSVVRIEGDKMHRYDMGEQNRSPVFVRSFSFFEDRAGNLFTIGYNGSIFRFDAPSDQFIQQKDFYIPNEVSHVLFVDDYLLIGSRAGLFRAQIVNKQIRFVENILPVSGVSHLALAPDSSVIVSTYGVDLYRISFDDGFKWEDMYFNFNGINHSYVTREGDLWVATDKGMVLVQRNAFTLADPNSQGQFIEGITNDPDGNIFFATKETLVRLTPSGDGEWLRKQIINESSNYFQALRFSKAGLWAATSWNVFLLRDEKIIKSFDFSDEGNFVHHLLLDSSENLWLSQAGSKRIKCITPSFEVKSFAVEGLGQSQINYMEEAADGIYAVGNGIASYIFFKEREDSIFRNISVRPTFDVRGDFNVLNLAFMGTDIWLATSEGLLKFDRLKLHRENKGQVFERFSVSCVKVFDREQLLFSNSFGLFRYNITTGEYWLYDEDSGLPSNTILEHGIHITEDSVIWVGTSFGIATARDRISVDRMTRTPFCVEARVNGVPRRYIPGLKASFGSYITLQFSPVSFPENKIEYQWKMDSEEAWRPLGNGLLSLPDIEEGTHLVYVRAKKNTGLSWSMPASMALTIDPPYWKKPEFVFVVLLLAILIAWASYAISSSIMNQRKFYLEAQISQRTQELKKANEELTIRNTELDRFVYSASHDLSAPLKSILGLIRVAKLDNPDAMHRQYLDMMERSVFKLEDFIEEVVTYSRNTRMPLKFERLEFRQFVQNLLQDHQYSPNFREIEFIIEDHTGEEMVSDITRMKIILNNLISNAIKFHWISADRKPFIRIALSKTEVSYILTVSDNGRGIDEEHLSRIFEMFYRATDDAQGSGLGLYILKEAVLKLGGTVEARPVHDSGTEFVIMLPVPAATIATQTPVDS